MKSLNLLFILLVVELATVSFFNKNDTVANSLKLDSQNVVPKYKVIRNTSKNKNQIIHTDEIILGLNKIVVSTYYLNDTLSEHDAWESIQWPIVEKQTIAFQFRDSICSIMPFSTRWKKRKTNKGKIIKSPRIVIWNSTFIEGSKESFFEILEASDICMGAYCSTYDGLFRLNGDPIYQLYKDEEKKIILLLGKKPYKKIIFNENDFFSLDTLYERNGISKEMIKNGWSNRFCIGVKCE